MRKSLLFVPGSLLLGFLTVSTLQGQGERQGNAAPLAPSGSPLAPPPTPTGLGPATSLSGDAPAQVTPAPTATPLPESTGTVLNPGIPLIPNGITPPPVAPSNLPVGYKVDSTGMGPGISVTWEPPKAPRPPRNLIDQTEGDARAKSAGCMECHTKTDSMSMHTSPNVVLGCTDCHGGNAKRGLTITQAHVVPEHPEMWESSANPPNGNVVLNHESPEFIRFINPGDLRVADTSCGTCHGDITRRVPSSMMNHGSMLWNAAAYNNGAIDIKNSIVGQSYGQDGTPLQLFNPFKPTAEETRKFGWLETLVPLPRFARSMPGNTFRIFEKGGLAPLQIGSPTVDEPPGKPERRLSDRGLGTLNRTDPTILGASKTRLHDPLLGFMGTNDHPGDYRSSGCSACHVVYANDRSPSNSGWWHRFGNQGLSFSKDPTIPKNERGHPVVHQFTNSIPSSQCMNCHMHQGNLFVNPYLGYIWWDQETEGQHMYPKVQHDPTDDELVVETRANPEAASARGLWKDLNFLEKTSELNPQLKDTQFADYHGHGWVFRAIFKKDRKGNLLDLEDNKIDHGDFKKAVHLKDIHLARGMQCVDCHFEVEVHGNGLLYGEPRNVTTITCVDCHGTITDRPTLMTSGAGGTWDGHSRKTEPVNLATLATPFGPRFEWEDVIDPTTGKAKMDPKGAPIRRLYQNSNMTGQRWEIPLTADVIDPTSPKYNAKARYAKTLHRDGEEWGTVPDSPEKCQSQLAHSNQNMDCQICHSSWATSCFGCHLPLKINQHVPQNKYEGQMDRGYVTYNPQVVRDDVFQLGIDGTVKKHRMAVIRSSSAVVVSSQNSNREWVYSQQQTVSGDGYSGQAFNPHFPHTTSGKGTTKGCTDCHLSKANDNNAWISSLLGFGTSTVNFFGRYAWVGGEGGFHSIVWTEPDEPQAAIGSNFQKLAYPKNFDEHLANGRILKSAYEHHAKVIEDLTIRGEYLYTANGPAGLEVFDTANFDQKGFSERLVTAPVSPLGQRTYVRSKYATSVALPSTLLNDSGRLQSPANEEQPISKFYGHVYVTDKEEGLFIVNVETLFDGNPENNFLRRLKLVDGKGGKETDHFNPDGRLTGATYGVCAGERIFIATPRGLSVVDLSDVHQPRLVGELTDGFLKNPKAIYIQFRYAFITDDEGLKVVDISNPEKPRAVRGAVVPLRTANKLYVARTYAYVANGPQGLAIIDVENPERPKLVQMFDADGQMNDTRAVQIGSIAASMYALIADGHNGFRVLQMISPDTVPGSSGFSPKPSPRLISTYPMKEPALAVSRGLDRDRVVDETGNQTVVFGRRGARPFKLDEMRPFLRHLDGSWYRVEDVAVKDGKLKTSSGRELTAPEPPKPAVVPGAPSDALPPDNGTLKPLDLPGATISPATPAETLAPAAIPVVPPQ